ncbi:SWI/SNF-related matrix-associated actin-dependent regulator of chromatin subfamily E member 1-related-like [Tubulanus polymorphus]|uniref:SWI/SNF-related matrix-associated actin-dependent regulator of chromatin subfamily E member 1-related-like n=1 Tax=Tubulanus polymorphus TaxID=672921 RepID=UPI003DA25C9A
MDISPDKQQQHHVNDISTAGHVSISLPLPPGLQPAIPTSDHMGNEPTGNDVNGTVIQQAQLQIDTVKGVMCMKVGDTVYQMPLAINTDGLEPGSVLSNIDNELLTSQMATAPHEPSALTIAEDVSLDGSSSEQGTLKTTSAESMMNYTNINAVIEQTPQTETVKRKGGWPKGKKRRKDITDPNAPKAPNTGYVLFALDRRKIVSALRPELSFSQVTKILGSEWSSLPPTEKQKYIDRGEADKKKYIKDLEIYQKSEAYQEYLKKKKQKSIAEGGDASYLDLGAQDSDLLYCKVCDKLFSSQHNKKEHMFGKQHLNAVKGEFEQELHNQETVTINSDDSQDSDDEGVNVGRFVNKFLAKNLEREMEIRQLQRTLKIERTKHINLCKQVTEMRELEVKLEQELAMMKNYYISLNAQIDALKMVPTLFGVINF